MAEINRAFVLDFIRYAPKFRVVQRETGYPFVSCSLHLYYTYFLNWHWILNATEVLTWHANESPILFLRFMLRIGQVADQSRWHLMGTINPAHCSVLRVINILNFNVPF